MKVLFIVNPFSGIKNWEAVVRYIQQSWGPSGHDFEIISTWKVGDGEKYARKAAEEKLDMVIAVGGDGTINDVARGLLGSDTALGVVPAGSGNGFARHFGIPLSRKKAVPMLLEPEFDWMDLGEVNGRIFLVTCGAGMDAHITRLFNAGPRRGLLSYIVSSIRSFLGYRPPKMKIVIEEGEIDVEPILITAANLAQYGGGVRVAPDADPMDGYLDLCIIKRMSPLLILYHLPKLFTGRIKRVPATTILKIKKVTIISEPLGPVHVDGDLMGQENTLKIKVLPKALKIAVGRKR